MVVPDSARVTASKIATQPFANIYNLINNRSNVPDPVDTTGNRKFVYTRFPHIGRKFVGFPFVIVRRTMPSKGRNTVNLSKTFRSFDFIIEVMCQDKDSDSEANPNALVQCNDITDNIIKTLENRSNRLTLINQGMANLEYDIESVDDDEFEGRSIFRSEFDIRFERNLSGTT